MATNISCLIKSNELLSEIIKDIDNNGNHYCFMDDNDDNRIEIYKDESDNIKTIMIWQRILYADVNSCCTNNKSLVEDFRDFAQWINNEIKSHYAKDNRYLVIECEGY